MISRSNPNNRSSCYSPPTHELAYKRRPSPHRYPRSSTLSSTKQYAQLKDTSQKDEKNIFDALKTLTQACAIILPLGYAAIPLTAQAIGDPGIAAFSIEGIELASIYLLLKSKAYAPTINFGDMTSIGLGILAATAALAVNQGILLIIHPVLHSNTSSTAIDTVLQASSSQSALLLYIASAVLAPWTEELLYRGFFLSYLQEATDVRFMPITAAAFSAVLFAVLHLQSTVSDSLISIPQLIVVGFALGIAVNARQGNLATSLIGHCLYNTALFVDLILS